ncbi:MAG: hypothetical protein AAF907_11515 [Planctomycetota bacterium]
MLVPVIALNAAIALPADPPPEDSEAETHVEPPETPPVDPPVYDENRILRGPEDAARISGVEVFEVDGQKVIVNDRRIDRTPLVLHGVLTAPLVRISSSVSKEFPTESFAVIGLPRADRMQHIRKVAPAGVSRTLSALDGVPKTAGPATAVRVSRGPQYVVMNSRRPDYVPQPGEAPRLYVSVRQWIEIPSGIEMIEAKYSSIGGDDMPGGEFWEYKTPELPNEEEASEEELADLTNAEPRWIRTKSISGAGGFFIFPGRPAPLP